MDMETPLIALIWFALWAVALVLFVGIQRVASVLGRKAKPNDFPAGQKHGSEFYWRCNRAHANVVENLPIFGAIVLGGVAAEVTAPIFGTLALVVAVARVVQSVIHMAGGSAMMVNLRFTAYAVQLVCFIWMGILVLGAVY